MNKTNLVISTWCMIAKVLANIFLWGAIVYISQSAVIAIIVLPHFIGERNLMRIGRSAKTAIKILKKKGKK